MVYFYRMFPKDIWLYMSEFIPEESGALCYTGNIPYSYVRSVTTYDVYLISKLHLFSNLKRLEFACYELPPKLPNLRSVFMPNFTGSLEPLRRCVNLHTLDMPNFNGSLEPLRSCVNLHILYMDNFTGSLELLSECVNL